MGKLTELLAERCEKATRANTSIDADIERTLGMTRTNSLEQEVFGNGKSFRPKRYTSSLDAAMTLVPEEVRLAGLSQKMNGSGWYVHLMHRESREHFEARGDTCPLTLCAAALRARTQNTPDSQSRDAPR